MTKQNQHNCDPSLSAFVSPWLALHIGFRHSSFVLRHFFALLVLAAPASAAEKVTFEKHVKPILREHCFACHNQDDATASLALDSFDGIAAGGAGGEIVAAGDPDGSRLWKLVTHEEEPKMPPGDKLPKSQLDVLRAWIEGGLLKNDGSKPIRSKKPAIVKIDASKLGKPVGEPAMPEQLFHQPVLWAPHVGPIDALATSPWAPLVAIAWQRQVSIYDTNTYKLLGILPYVDGVPRVVQFSRDGSLILIAGGRHAAAGSAALFDVKTGARLVTLGDELDIVLAADISPDLSLVAIGGPKKKVRVYRVADGSLAYEISKHTDWITAIGFSPDGRLLATADRSNGALIWQASAGHERADLRGHKGAISALDWRGDSTMLATASEDGTVRLWNPGGKQIKSVNAHKGGVLAVRFAKDGKFVTAGRDQKVKTWKSDGGAIAELGKLNEMAMTAAFTHDGEKVVASDYTGEVRVFDAANKKQLASLAANTPLLAQRLAVAEAAWQQAKQQTQTHEARLQTQLAALEQGKAAQAAYEKKLATTQTMVTAERKEYENLTKLQTTKKQTLAAARKSAEQANAKLAEAEELLTEAKKPVDETVDEKPAGEQLAALEAVLESARKAKQIAKAQAQQARKEFKATETKRQTAEKSLQAAEAKVAQVAGETAGLPDLGKLTEQVDQVRAKLDTSKKQLLQAEQAKAVIMVQQERYAAATKRFDGKAKEKQDQQQELAKRSEQLSQKHQQAASKLASHKTELADITEQLKKIQNQLTELKSVETALQQQESKLAAELSKIQETLSVSQQQVELLEASKRDFLAAEELRASYSTNEKATAEQE